MPFALGPCPALLFVALALGCTSPAPPAEASPDGRGPSLRRLSRAEYYHTLRDLLGVDVCAGCTLEPDALAPDDNPGSFASTLAAARPSPLLLDQYRDAAEAVAGRAVGDLRG